MNRLSLCGLAVLLIIASRSALAGHGSDFYVEAYVSHHNVHYRSPHYRHDNRHANRAHQHTRQQRYYYPRSYYFPNHYGLVAVGPTLSFSLYHRHRGKVCYDRHSGRDYRGAYHSEVVGCHRIERFPDGSHRRVDVPVAQCY